MNSSFDKYVCLLLVDIILLVKFKIYQAARILFTQQKKIQVDEMSVFGYERHYLLIKLDYHVITLKHKSSVACNNPEEE